MTRLIPWDRARWMTSLAAAAALALALMAVLMPTPTGLSDLGSGGSSAATPGAGHLPASAGSSSVLDPRIAALATHHPDQAIETIVQFQGNVSADRARWLVTRDGGHVFAQLHIINALAVRVTAERARWLAANPAVHAVSLNAVVRSEGKPRLDRLPRKPGALNIIPSTYDQTLGVATSGPDAHTGAGVGVAVIDTGIDGDLPDFQGANGSRVIATAVTNPRATTATDSYGHGTDVAGIVAGNGDNLAPSDKLKGKYVGVAPDANLVSIKASDESGNATVLDVIYGLQFAVDHKSQYNIRVVNMSLDSQTQQSYTTDPLDAAAESVWMHGIVVVVAAGNQGDDDGAVSYAPANDPYVITVGAINENATADPKNDTIVGWSSRGTTQDGFQKPDLYAPGAHIVSVLAPNSVFASLCPTCIIGGEYIHASGTSMAAPMISGLVADLLQDHPFWSPDQVKGALTSPSTSSNPGFQEPDGAKLFPMWLAPRADQGLTPSSLLDASTGDIDYTRSSWSRSSWSTATGTLSAGFARSSWSCTCSVTSSGTVDPSRSSWSRSSWSTHFDPNYGLG
jgi:serine protease AprX